MKKHLLIALAMCACAVAYAQDCDMPLRIVIPEQVEALDATSQQQLKNKLRNIIVQNGIIGGSDASPFAITASIDVLGQEILPGMPTKFVYMLGVNLYIVNLVDQKIFSSTSVTVSCAGNSQTKAYINGIQQLSPSNPDVRSCIAQGKTKMIDYYDKNYTTIIKQARAQAVLRNYEEAIYLLMAVPACSVGYDAAMSEVKDIYQQYVDRQCVENLAQAQAAWMSGFTMENATVASVYLSEIYPDAACYADAQALVAEIKKHMGDEWNFKLKQWDDLADIEAQRLQYSREIAIAFAQNQPDQAVSFIFR